MHNYFTKTMHTHTDYTELPSVVATIKDLDIDEQNYSDDEMNNLRRGRHMKIMYE